MNTKYFLDTENLIYKKVSFSLKSFLSSIWLNIVIAIFGGAILGTILFKTVKSPELKKLEEENKNIVYKIQQLDKQFNKLLVSISKIQTKDDNLYRKILGLNSLPNYYKYNYQGGVLKYKRLENLPYNDLLRSIYTKSDLVNYQLASQAKSFKEINYVVSNKEKILDATPSIIPIPRNKLIRIGSRFGMRFHPILHIYRMHAGIDLTAPKGTPIYATADGIVIRADAASKGYGNHVKIAHGFGYMTVYAHLSKINVKPGQKVKRGTLIGLVGSTGLSTSPHLHYEVRINNRPVNPINFFFNDLTDEQYEQIIKRAQGEEFNQ